jgi:hypothetical protein
VYESDPNLTEQLEMTKMALMINDLPQSDVLDRAARAELCGGQLPPFVQNLIAQFRITEFTQNAVSVTVLNQGAVGSISNQFNIAPLSAASPMTFIQSA